MAIIEEDFLALSKQLYPSGRAFWIPAEGVFEGLCSALNLEKVKFYSDALSLYDDLLPDNNNFSADDATVWERIYGLQSNGNLTLDQRKAALFQVMSFPGPQPARQHYLFIQGELQEAGFNVFVYENIAGQTPFDVSGDPSIFTYIEHGDIEHGDQQHGLTYNNKIANSINKKDDLLFNVGSDLSATFFIGGPTLGSFANVPLTRHDEFRQLILKFKPLSTVGFLFIHYT